jgi:predicted phosphodiesterase
MIERFFLFLTKISILPARVGIVILLSSHMLFGAETPADALREAQVHSRAKAYQQVIDVLTPHLEAMDPGQLRIAHLRMGDAWRGLEDRSKAEDHYEAAIWLEGLNSADRLLSSRHYGIYLNETEQWEKATEHYLRFYQDERIMPNEKGVAVQSLGNLWQRQGNFERAHQYYKLYDGEVFLGWKTHADLEGRAAEMLARLQAPIEFWIAPYTTHVGETRAVVTWVSHTGAPESQLTVTAPDFSGALEYTRSPVRSEAGFDIHRVELTGLEPGVRHAFTVTSGEETRNGSFRTAPSESAPRPVHFLVYGDSQDRPNFHRQTSAVMAQEEADFVLHAGDLVGRGNYWGHWWYQFFGAGNALFQHTPVWPTYGNHDGGPFYSQFFTHDRPNYHNFRYGDVEVFVLSSYGGGSPGSSVRDQQLAWLKKALAESTAPWKVAITHYPMISEDSAGWSNWGQEDFWPLLEEGEVDFVFVGHHHVYRRIRPISQGGQWAIRHVTSGGAASVGGDYGFGGTGFPLRGNPLSEIGMGALHYLSIEVDGPRLTYKAVQRDGSLMDSFTLDKSDREGYREQLVAESLPWDIAAEAIKWLADFMNRNFEVPVALLEVPSAGEAVSVEVRHHVSTERTVGFHFGSVENNPWEMVSETGELDGHRFGFSMKTDSPVLLAPGRITPSPVVGIGWTVEGISLPMQEFRLTLSEDGYMELADKLENGTRLPLVWRFQFDPQELGTTEQWYRPDLDDSDWSEAPVTRPWNEVFDVEYNGNAWYRVVFNLPELNGNDLWLEFGTVDESCWVYLNGVQLAAQEYDSLIDDDAWRKPRRFNLTPALRDGENVIAVRVRANIGEGGIYRGSRLYRSSANLLIEGGFDHGLKGWKTVSEASPRYSDLPGRYVGERAIEFDLEGVGEIHLRSEQALPMEAGHSYSILLALDQRVAPTREHGVILGVHSVETGEWHEVIRLPAMIHGRWEEVQATWTPSTSGSYQWEIRLPGEAWYLVDELSITVSNGNGK